MNEFKGEVVVRECEYYDGYFTYGDVANGNDYLTEILEDYQGKKVSITIEVIDG